MTFFQEKELGHENDQMILYRCGRSLSLQQYKLHFLPFIPLDLHHCWTRLHLCACFCSWGRWKDILSHGRFKRPLHERDVEMICRALLAYCLLHYRGDENIKSFIWDLITPTEDGQSKTLTNHSGIHEHTLDCLSDSCVSESLFITSPNTHCICFSCV